MLIKSSNNVFIGDFSVKISMIKVRSGTQSLWRVKGVGPWKAGRKLAGGTSMATLENLS